jgi:hypothetical protein
MFVAKLGQGVSHLAVRERYVPHDFQAPPEAQAEALSKYTFSMEPRDDQPVSLELSGLVSSDPFSK